MTGDSRNFRCSGFINIKEEHCSERFLRTMILQKKSDQGGLPKQAASRTDSSRTHTHLYTLVIFCQLYCPNV
nr:MAG TPA: hypothetical protein [Caudoviricetes sp.]